MPPPIEEEEEIVSCSCTCMLDLSRASALTDLHKYQDSDEGSSSEQLASDETVLNNADVLIAPSQSFQSRESTERVVSDIPLVTSDIQPTRKMTAPEPVSLEFSRRDTGIKRKTPPKRSNDGVRTTIVPHRDCTDLGVGGSETEKGQ